MWNTAVPLTAIFLQHSPINDVDAVYNTVKTEFKEKYNIEVLSPNEVQQYVYLSRKNRKQQKNTV